MKILVTGGAGFIGSHLVDNLMSKGYKVRVFDNLSAGKLSNLNQWYEDVNFEFFKGDLLDTVSIKHALIGCSAVYHLAANPEVRSNKASPKDHFTQNIEGTFNLLEAIREYGEIQFLGFTSTSTVYGEPSIIPTSETYAPLKPISNYGASKLAADVMVQEYGKYFDMNTVSFRAGCIAGPKHSGAKLHGFLPYLMKCAMAGQPYTVNGYKGKQVRDNMHVFDLVNAFDHFYENPKKGEVYNIGGGRDNSFSVLEAIELCERITGKSLNSFQRAVSCLPERYRAPA